MAIDAKREARDIFLPKHTLIRVMFRKVLIVMVLGAFLTAITTAINTYFVANFFNDEFGVGTGVSGLSLALTAMTFIDIFPAVLTLGTQAKTAGAMANFNKKRADQFVTTGILLALGSGVILLLLNFFAAKPIAFLLAEGRNEALQLVASEYLRGFAFGIPFYIVNKIIRSVDVLDSDRTSVYLSLVAVVGINVVGNVLNAYIFHGGVFAVGLITSLSFFISSLILSLHFFKKRALLSFGFKYFNLKIAKELLIRGSVSATKALCKFLFSLFTSYTLLTIGGPASLTILGIQANCFMILNSFIDGFYDGGFILNHVFTSVEDTKALGDIVKLLVRFTIIFIATLSIFFIITAPQIALTYKLPEENLTELIIAIRCSIAVVPFVALQTIVIVISPTKYCHFIYLMRLLIFPAIFTSCLGYTLGPNAFWIGNAIGACMYIPVHFIWARIKYGHWPHNIVELFLLPKDFGFLENESLRCVIESKKDGETLLNVIRKYGERLKLDSNTLGCLMTCVDSVLIFYDEQHVYKNKDHLAEILIYYKNGQFMIRIHDNSGIEFKISEDQQMILKNPNLRYAANNIVHSSKSVRYNNIINVSAYLIVV